VNFLSCLLKINDRWSSDLWKFFSATSCHYFFAWLVFASSISLSFVLNLSSVTLTVFFGLDKRISHISYYSGDPFLYKHTTIFKSIASCIKALHSAGSSHTSIFSMVLIVLLYIWIWWSNSYFSSSLLKSYSSYWFFLMILNVTCSVPWGTVTIDVFKILLVSGVEFEQNLG